MHRKDNKKKRCSSVIIAREKRRQRYDYSLESSSDLESFTFSIFRFQFSFYLYLCTFKFFGMSVVTKSKIQKVAETLKEVRKIAIVSHFNPDGDAVGSSLALYHYFRNAGFDVTSILPNPFPSFLAWMPLSSEIIVA